MPAVDSIVVRLSRPSIRKARKREAATAACCIIRDKCTVAERLDDLI